MRFSVVEEKNIPSAFIVLAAKIRFPFLVNVVEESILLTFVIVQLGSILILLPFCLL